MAAPTIRARAVATPATHGWAGSGGRRVSETTVYCACAASKQIGQTLLDYSSLEAIYFHRLRNIPVMLRVTWWVEREVATTSPVGAVVVDASSRRLVTVSSLFSILGSGGSSAGGGCCWWWLLLVVLSDN